MGAARSRFDWTWLLIALCAVALAFVVSETVETFNGNARFWDVGRYWEGEPYVLVFGEPRPGGAGARAGILKGDRLDLREQTLAVRLLNSRFTRPPKPLTLVVRRNGKAVPMQIAGSTVWEGATLVKLFYRLVPAVTGFLLLGCALLIVARRAARPEGRALALILLCLVPSDLPFIGAIPFLDGLVWVGFVTPLIPLALLLALSSRFGARSAGRTVTQWVAAGAIAASIAGTFATYYGTLTLRFDPLPTSYSPIAQASGFVSALLTLAAAVAAVAGTQKGDRARTGWLLLPLAIAILTSTIAADLVNYAPSWVFYAGGYILASASLLLGALAVTYALFRRRVVDVGFVLSRTIVFTIVSLIVVVAFVLLEWALGAVLADVSHTTGLFANAALALALGFSMRYIHTRVDRFVDSVLFRKRHEDERALRAFAKEASFITATDALFDLALANVRSHTNATGAALLMNGNGEYRNIRAYGDVPASASENDPVILALKASHEPLDPHRYETALTGDLVLPIVSRGTLHGVLLFEQRASGEAYAPDEIDALAAFAHGIGSAYDALAQRGEETNATVAAISALLERRFGPLQ